ncbi:type IV pilin protein [Blautia sp. HCP3S3_C4]|uniref:type IV pilin protein n=1 Tax=Blautia sp. HCP3S3_C4 TaxID=3438911 RepID=UPI003F8A099D
MFKFLKEKKKDNKGFTLVELVIVIAILAILVGLLAPQYTKYVEKSRKSADASNMDEMVKAVQVYAADGTKEVPEVTKKTIVLEKDKVTVDNQLKPALEEYCPDYANMKLKSAKWTKNPTATINITSDGAVTVTYEPKEFAEYIGGKETNPADAGGNATGGGNTTGGGN